MPEIIPNLWFADEAEQAIDYYTDVFDETSVGETSRYTETLAGQAGLPAGSVLTIDFELEGQRFVALNGGPAFEFNPSISFFVNCPSHEDVDELWAALSEGGSELMPLDEYPFSERYAWIEDAHGLSWQLMFVDEADERSIVPSLMFVDERYGRAEEAIHFYTSAFDDAEIASIARYGPDHPHNEEGTVMFADFTLAGQRFAAMDAGLEHGFTFNEAISFAVECEDQEAIDSFWEALRADGGEEQMCGWLTDRFGVSWQVVPDELDEMLRDDDPERADRVAEAMLAMNKLDVARLRQAFAR